jgi:hypothetical protein
MTNQAVVVRTYRAKNAADANRQFSRDAVAMGGIGYVPGSPVWVQAGRGRAAQMFIVAGILFLVVGLLFLPLMLVAIPCLAIGLLSGRSGGLTVTYQYRAPAPMAPAPPVDHVATIGQLAEMRERGLITPDEYEAKKSELLARV